VFFVITGEGLKLPIPWGCKDSNMHCLSCINSPYSANSHYSTISSTHFGAYTSPGRHVWTSLAAYTKWDL